MRKAVELNPALLLFFQALMGALFGPRSLMIATPLLTVVQIVVTTLWIERRLHKTPPSDEAPSATRAEPSPEPAPALH
jgi:predicted PurR-regulated permease PerM